MVLHVVDTLKKECKFVYLSLIPKPVISLFQRLKQRKGPIPNPPSAGMDWSRVEAKLSSTLMQFQRDGVEYVIMYMYMYLNIPSLSLVHTLHVQCAH